MNWHWWIEIKSPLRVGLFLAAVALLAIVAWSLPPEAWYPVGYRRRMFTPAAAMCCFWLTGWFVLLFVRAEDLNVLHAFNYQKILRSLGVIAILLGFLAGVFTVARYW
jgi:hypothetical protein